jgi:pimeloyl-ACP methyl ester carboxylesterase
MNAVHHRFACVEGWQLFYREAGPPGAPTVVLLHGFPTSSYMYRNLIPVLADSYHVVAPDYLGFGFSDAPSVGDFDYSFDALAQLTGGLLAQLGLHDFAMYVQDYGAPIGWRLALWDPESVLAIITQNGNGYEAGFDQGFWNPIRKLWHQRSPATEAAIREAFTLESIKWQYTHGVSDPSVVSPDTWHHDYAMVSRPGNDLIQLELLCDYETNPPLYPRLHAYLRESQVPLLAIWGRNDGIFNKAGAVAFADDAVNAEIHLLDGGHFLLESMLDETAFHVRRFLEVTLS